MMYVNCKIHNEKMNEYLDHNEIIPYCLSCIVDQHVALSHPSKPSLKKRITAILRTVWSNISLVVVAIILTCLATIMTSILIVLIGNAVINHFHYNAPNKEMYYFLVYCMILITYIVFAVLYIVRKKKDQSKMKKNRAILEKAKLQIHVFNYQNQVEQFKKELEKNYDLSKATLKNVMKYDDKKIGELIKSFFKKKEYTFFRDYEQKDTFINFILKQNEEKIGVQYRERNTIISDAFVQEIQANQKALKCQQMIIITSTFFTEMRFNDCKYKNIHLWNKEMLLIEILKENENSISWKEHLLNSYNLDKINQIPSEKWS